MYLRVNEYCFGGFCYCQVGVIILVYIYYLLICMYYNWDNFFVQFWDNMILDVCCNFIFIDISCVDYLVMCSVEVICEEIKYFNEDEVYEDKILRDDDDGDELGLQGRVCIII